MDDLIKKIEENPHIEDDVKEAVQLLKMNNIRLTNVVRDIIETAQNRPQQLVAFSSPILQIAIMLVFEIDNPDAKFDENSFRIFQEQFEKQRNPLYVAGGECE